MSIKKKIVIGLLAFIAIILYFFAELFLIIYLNSTKQTELTVSGDTLFISNIINSKTPLQIEEIFNKNPNIKKLTFKQVAGSVDDEANIKVANWLLSKKINTHLDSDSEISSGGVDLFLVGVKRTIENGARVGVHSWGDGVNQSATDFPVDHPLHTPYIEYYKNAGFTQKEAEDFYFFTIHAAPYNSMYWMSNEEMIKYKITTTKIKNIF